MTVDNTWHRCINLTNQNSFQTFVYEKNVQKLHLSFWSVGIQNYWRLLRTFAARIPCMPFVWAYNYIYYLWYLINLKRQKTINEMLRNQESYLGWIHRSPSQFFGLNNAKLKSNPFLLLSFSTYFESYFTKLLFLYFF